MRREWVAYWAGLSERTPQQSRPLNELPIESPRNFHVPENSDPFSNSGPDLKKSTQWLQFQGESILNRPNSGSRLGPLRADLRFE